FLASRCTHSIRQEKRWFPTALRGLPRFKRRHCQESVPPSACARDIESIIEGTLLYSTGYPRSLQPDSSSRGGAREASIASPAPPPPTPGAARRPGQA